MDDGQPAGATPPVRRETLVEAVGYVGAAAAVAGTVLGEPSPRSG